MRLPDHRTTANVLMAAVMVIAPSAGLAQTPGRAAAVATTSHFAFYSDFATNLNDAVIAAGAARRAKKPELFHWGAETACFDGLPTAERAAWNRVVDYYAEIVSPAQYTAPVQALPRLELAGILTKEESDGGHRTAVPRNRERFPPRRGLGVPSGVGGLLRTLPIAVGLRGSCLCLRPRRDAAQRLPVLYGTPWAGMPFRVDVVETVSFAGADPLNLLEPGLHILVRLESNNQGREALEIVFHEASHFLTGAKTPLRAALAAAARDAGGAVGETSLTLCSST